MEQMKFKVDGEEQSRRLQDVLYGLGYAWGHYASKYDFADMPYIFTKENGDILYTDYVGADFFNDDNSPQYDVEEFIAKHTLQPKKVERIISVGELVNRFEKEPQREKSDGGKTGYYDLVIKTKEGDFRCVVGDVIRAMVGNDFDLGNAIKAIRRIYADSQGFGKEGIDMQYDANKINYFVKEFVEFNSR